MEHVLPVLQIDDYAAAVDFYVDKLGFHIAMEHRHEPGFPVFMVVKKGNLALALSEHGRGHPGSEVYLYVDDVNAWYHRCTAAGIAPVHPPQAQPWGNTEMLLQDPSRNALRFSQVGTHEGRSTPHKPSAPR